MINVTITLRDGRQREFSAVQGSTLMESIRDAGEDELMALCGGCCSCATCHIIVDDTWIDRVGHADGDENELLDSSSHRTAASRLSCQVTLHEALNGMRATIAPED